jgi:hypothetical protein
MLVFSRQTPTRYRICSLNRVNLSGGNFAYKTINWITWILFKIGSNVTYCVHNKNFYAWCNKWLICYFLILLKFKQILHAGKKYQNLFCCIIFEILLVFFE